MVNKVILLGNVGQDPEIKRLSEDSVVANFSLATSSKKGDQEYTEWHNIVIWNKLAEVVEKYVTKGMKLYLEGSLRTRTWEDKDGNKRYTTEVICFTMQMLTPKKDNHATEPAPQGPEGFDPNPDDLPF